MDTDILCPECREHNMTVSSCDDDYVVLECECGHHLQSKVNFV